MTDKAKQLRDLLKARGMTIGDLVRLSGVGRAQISQCINGLRKGPETRDKIAMWLTQQELDVLGWPPSEPDYSI